MKQQLSAFFVVISALGAATASAAPTVTSYELVSSTRYGRTAFDYTYRVRVTGDSKSYTGASFTVSSNNPAATLVDNSVALGEVDAGRILFPTDTFTIRHERTVALTPASLSFAFTGTVAGANSNSSIEIGSIKFLEFVADSLHPGSFPIQHDTPSAGSEAIVRIQIGGPVTGASYRLVGLSGSQLATGPLQRAADAPSTNSQYFASIQVPYEDFQIEVIATQLGASTVTRRSAAYYLPAVQLKIVPTKAVLDRGEAVALNLQVQSISASGPHDVRLIVPAPLHAATTTWRVSLSPGQSTQLSTTLVAPTPTAAFSRYIVALEAGPVAGSRPPSTATLRFWVE